jgi:hypothetical protein
MSDETTVILEEDVAAKVADATQRMGTSVHDFVNATLRRTVPGVVIQPKPFHVRPRRMGAMTGLDVNCTERLLNEVEGPNWK